MAITLSGDGITRANLAADVIDGTKIEDDAVGTEHLANAINTDIAAKLPLAGGTMTGHITGGDNIYLKLGAGDDLQLHHDGSNSYIVDDGTGDLILRGTANVKIQGPTGEAMLTATSDGSIELYENNVKKLETTSTGINVTGAIAGATNLGKVLQVVSATVGANTTSTSSTFAAADASLTITPAATSSKILIQFMGGRCGFSGSGGGDGAIKLYQTISGGSATSVEGTDRGISNFFGFGDFYAPVALQFIASPNTTSAVTYQIYIARRSGTGTFSLSRDGSQSPNMTLMEIGA